MTTTIDSFLSYTIGIVVFLTGAQLNRRIAPLRSYNIPELVTGGLLAAGAVFLIYLAGGVEIGFELDTRDRLLVYFFTAIAWAPDIAVGYGVANALEIGVASATLGLVIASLIGGPIAKYLHARWRWYQIFRWGCFWPCR